LQHRPEAVQITSSSKNLNRLYMNTQQPTVPRVVCYGEILWDILPDKKLPGGAPMNVAYHLNKLGTHSALISNIGTDELGEGLVRLLSQSGLTTDFVQVDDHYSTGIVNAKVKEHNEMEYDIVHPVAWDFIEWKDTFTQLLAEADYFVYGSLTSRSAVSRDTLYQLLEVAKTKVLDINLRPPYINQSHLEYLLRKTDVLKMNSSELELIAGWYSDVRPYEDRMKLLQDRFQLETVMVTMGGEGALLLNRNTFYRHYGYKVRVADTIGSGDAFLAGFLHQLLSGASAEKALTYASGLGALIASYSGACPHYEKSEVPALISSRLYKEATI
jgi:fructokinase